MNNIIIQTPKGKREIGQGQPVFIVAEMSANHNQSYEKALKIIEAAAEAGVDAVKLQTYTADTITINSAKDYFQIKGNSQWSGQTLHQLYQKAYTPWDWQPKLKEYAESKGLFVFSSPFDNTAVDFLEKMDIGLYKVASFEVVDIPLLKRIGQTKKPVIMSRGMASIEEIELAIKILKENGCPQIALLHCVSSYPAKPAEMNLKTIPDMSEKFEVIVGLSDHSLSNDVSLVAVALGASIIEKHFILSRSEGGPDSAFSVEPDELKNLVRSIREMEKALGQPSYGAGINESENVIFRKSLFAVQDIRAGEKLTEKNIRSIRPGYGLMPKYYDEVMGKAAAVDIERGTPLSWDLIQK
ncbi:pseudaminic acid synthase [Patescibacteria group bacterium]|nr:pseudaminic acid synthase [Patescibacteria group bacterium]